MNYQIILDEQKLQDFIDWLPVLKQHEAYYVSLIGRKKYAPVIGDDKVLIKRFTSDKKRMINKIRQLEAPLGAYLNSKEEPLPQEALALYISLNPRNLKLAAEQAASKLVSLIVQPYNGYNPHKVVLSEIQKARSRRCFVDIDVDDATLTADGIKQTVLEAVEDENAFRLLATRGGYHILVDPNKVVNKKSWFVSLRQLFNFDAIGDNLIPVPGCTQGNFVPYFA
jgi:hypothetical protein